MKTLFVSIRILFILFVGFVGFVFTALAENVMQKTLEKPMYLPVNKVPLRFITSTGTHNYAVEIANTSEARETGLMFRKDFPKDRAMLFVYPAVSSVMMWMKNTLIPLDMVFIDESGKVVSLAYNTVPESRDLISSGFPVLYTVELNAGQIKKMNLIQGDCVAHPAIEIKCSR